MLVEIVEQMAITAWDIVKEWEGEENKKALSLLWRNTAQQFSALERYAFLEDDDQTEAIAAFLKEIAWTRSDMEVL